MKEAWEIKVVASFDEAVELGKQGWEPFGVTDNVFAIFLKRKRD